MIDQEIHQREERSFRPRPFYKYNVALDVCGIRNERNVQVSPIESFVVCCYSMVKPVGSVRRRQAHKICRLQHHFGYEGRCAVQNIVTVTPLPVDSTRDRGYNSLLAM